VKLSVISSDLFARLRERAMWVKASPLIGWYGRKLESVDIDNMIFEINDDDLPE
jgi:hypothetical protein